MRLNLPDFSGHPFQVQLSRELAARGHEVVHSFSTQYVTGHGRLEVTENDPVTLRIGGITAERPMVKYSPVGRTRFEVSYAKKFKPLGDQEPDDINAILQEGNHLPRSRRCLQTCFQGWQC